MNTLLQWPCRPVSVLLESPSREASARGHARTTSAERERRKKNAALSLQAPKRQRRGGAFLLPAACLRNTVSPGRHEHRAPPPPGNQVAAAWPTSVTGGVTFAAARRPERGGSEGTESAHPASQPTPACSSRRTEHRGEWCAEAPRLWGMAQLRVVSPSSPIRG
ncbi:hypothetical protein NDU88_005364 [Pleurodeles waltl]|uniref:Uncharacterized protein n=1 Tax=Pleurodeles waltl TaxID=8319 RepID=A0AAV7WAT6_PLEWA|nr:hypothetical protein NDU88_005364 [Pleurodeles waltl]